MFEDMISWLIPVILIVAFSLTLGLRAYTIFRLRQKGERSIEDWGFGLIFLARLLSLVAAGILWYTDSGWMFFVALVIVFALWGVGFLRAARSARNDQV